MNIEICFRDDITGEEIVIVRDTLRELHEDLVTIGYIGSSIKATDDSGWTIGWVNGKGWWYK